MSQHDFNIANQGFPAFRSDLNSALAALASTSSGATAPTTPYANQLWYDETNNILKMRDEANANWINIGTLDQIAKTFSVPTADSLAGLTASIAELNYLDITTLGTSQASKAVTADANGDVKFSNAVIETVFALSGTTPALNPNNGTVQTWTLSANSTPTDSFVAGETMTLMIDNGSAYTITWPTTTWVNNGGVAPTLATTGYTVVALWKVNTTLYGALVGDGS